MALLFIAAGIILPAATFLFLGHWHRQAPKRSLIALIAVELAVNGAVLLARRHWAGSWTNHELLLLNAVLSVTFSQLIAVIVWRRAFNSIEALKAVCLACTAVAVYSALTYGQVVLSSDCATATLLSKSQVAHRSLFPASWNYVNGDIWTIGNNTFTFPFVFLLRNQSLARAMGSALYAVVSALGICLISRKAFRDDSWVLAVPLFLIFLTGGEIYFVLYEAAYTGQMLWMALGFTMVYCAIYRRQPLYAGLYALMAIVLSAGGVRFIAEQTLPLLGAYVLYWYYQEREKKSVDWKRRVRQLVAVSALLLIPVGIGMAINRWLLSWHDVKNTSLNSMVLVDSLGTCWNNLIESILNLFRCFGFVGNVSVMSIQGLGSLVSVATCVLVCFVVPALQARKLPGESREVRLFYIFGMAHNAILFATTALFGLTIPRYMLTTVFVFIVMSARYIYVYWIGSANFRKPMWTTIFAVAAGIECLALVACSANWSEPVRARRAFNQALVDAGQTKGYASYWNAYSNELYSDLRIRYGAVLVGESGLTRFSWLVDEDVFSPQEGGTFLLLTGDEVNVLEPNIPAVFGTPRQTMERDGCRVYMFDHDIASDFSAGVQDGVLRPIEMHANEAVSREGDTLLLGQDGVVDSMRVYLAAGEYDVEYIGEDLDGAVCSIASDSKPEALAYSETGRAGDCIAVHLSVKEGVGDIAFSIANQTDGSNVSLKTINLKSAGAAA